MTAIANLPDLRPSLLLDFANSGSVDPRVNLVRGTAATCFGQDGKLRAVAAKVPRIDYDHLNGRCLGFVVEPNRTNLLIQSLALSGYDEGPNGVYAPGVTGIDGISLSRRVVANAVGGVFLNKHVAVNAGTYTLSVYFCANLKPTSGSLLYLEEIQADGTKIIKRLPFLDSSVLADGKWRRYEITVTHAMPGTAGVWFGVDPGVGEPFNLCAAQYEVGGGASSYIPTGGSAVTRAADVARFFTTDWSDDFTILFEGTKTDVVGAYPRYVSLSTGSYVREVFISEAGAGQLVLGSTTDGAVTSHAFQISTSNGQTFRAAMAYHAATQRLTCVVNGVYAAHITAPTLVATELGISCGPAGSDVVKSTVRRVAAYQRALTVEQMGRLTT